MSSTSALLAKGAGGIQHFCHPRSEGGMRLEDWHERQRRGREETPHPRALLVHVRYVLAKVAFEVPGLDAWNELLLRIGVH